MIVYVFRFLFVIYTVFIFIVDFFISRMKKYTISMFFNGQAYEKWFIYSSVKFLILRNLKNYL